MNKYSSNKCNCSYAGSQFIILSSIFAAIIAQEIESIDDLELLAAFLVALADELALAIVARSQCEAKLNKEAETIVEVVLDKDPCVNTYSQKNSHSASSKKRKKRIKVKKYLSPDEKKL